VAVCVCVRAGNNRDIMRGPLLLFYTSLLCARAYDDERCTEYAAAGYCTQRKMSAYMQRHCPDFCARSGSRKTAAADEDSACAKWATEGYCTNEAFAAYMSSNCPNACGVEPAAVDELGERLAEMVDSSDDDEDTEDYEVQEAQEAAAMQADAASIGASNGMSSSHAAEESDNCVGWAKQGLCETGAHQEYMKLNCARACATTEVGSGGSGVDRISCAQWALQGLCEEGNAHVAFMKLNCAEACEAEASRDPNAGLPPPAHWSMILIIAGFGYLAFYAVQQTIAKDSEQSLGIKKALGIASGIGEGKLNKSAVIGATTHRASARLDGHGQKRSAKKSK